MQNRDLEELVAYVERRTLDNYGVGNFVYEHEDLPPTDPMAGGSGTLRNFCMPAPAGNQYQTIAIESTSGTPVGVWAMQPLVNPTYSAIIAEGTQVF